MIIIEGTDRVGKDSVKKEYCINLDHEEAVITRAHISIIAFSRIYNRHIHESFVMDELVSLCKYIRPHIVLLTCQEDELTKRGATEEEIQNQAIFEEVCRDAEKHSSYIHIQRIDTTGMFIQEVAYDIYRGM